MTYCKYPLLAIIWLFLIQVHGYASGIDWGQPAFYGQTPWASVHRDSRNSDFAPVTTTSNLRVDWSLLEGAALINPGIIGPTGLHYVTSGRGQGFSHLHAFDSEGRMVWQSAPQTSTDDLDSLAAFNSPVVDPQGHVYVGDSNQFWAFRPDGEVKWVVELPNPDKPFVYQIISQQGYVGGITVAGEVLFYRAQDGSLALPPFQLPVGEADPKGPLLPGLWSGGLFDRNAADISKRIAFGYSVQVANAPAVHPETGRVFITAAGPGKGEAYTGVLYGLDIGEKQVKIGFALEMGGGSGTSPALSPDGRLVYAADGDGNMLGVDTETGAIRWRARGEGLLSPAIGSDGTLYTGDIFKAPTVFAMDGETGKMKWSRAYDDYAASLLPELEPFPPRIPSGKPVARLVSVISVSANQVWVGMELGYEYLPETGGPTLTIPHKTAICALRPEDGELLSCTLVRDSVEGMIKIGSAGRLYVSHTAIFSSTFYYGFNGQLPERYRLPDKPTGGLTALAPVSYCEQLSAELRWAGELISKLMSADSEANTTRQIKIQLASVPDTLSEAVKLAHLPEDIAERLSARIDELTIRLDSLQPEGTGSSQGVRDETGRLNRISSLADALIKTQSRACPALEITKVK